MDCIICGNNKVMSNEKICVECASQGWKRDDNGHVICTQSIEREEMNYTEMTAVYWLDRQIPCPYKDCDGVIDHASAFIDIDDNTNTLYEQTGCLKCDRVVRVHYKRTEVECME